MAQTTLQIFFARRLYGKISKKAKYQRKTTYNTLQLALNFCQAFKLTVTLDATLLKGAYYYKTHSIAWTTQKYSISSCHRATCILR